MKLTPEQKAFRDYGKALGILEERKSLMRFTECLGECSDYHGEPRVIYGVEEAIREALRKRAECRGWLIPNHERICENCNHEGKAPYANSCSECFRSPFVLACKGFCDNWEPGKEGK